MPIIVFSCQHCNEQQFQTLSCIHYTIFPVAKLDLYIRALLLDHNLVLEKNTCSPRIHLVIFGEAHTLLFAQFTINLFMSVCFFNTYLWKYQTDFEFLFMSKFCRLAHLGQMFTGCSGPVAFTGGAIVSTLWFPPDQRATATAIGTIAGFAGAAICFIIGK